METLGMAVDEEITIQPMSAQPVEAAQPGEPVFEAPRTLGDIAMDAAEKEKSKKDKAVQPPATPPPPGAPGAPAASGAVTPLPPAAPPAPANLFQPFYVL